MNAERELDALLCAERDREWPGPARNVRIEEFLMNEAKKGSPARARRAGVLFGVAGLLTAGAVFGATRLYEQYRVRLNVNGVETEHTVEAGPDGTAMMEVDLPNGGHVKLLVGKDNIGADGKIDVGVRVEGGAGETTTTVDAEGVESAPNTKK